MLPGWAVSQLNRNLGLVGQVEVGWFRARARGPGFGGLCVGSECILYAVVTPGYREGFERGFLGILEAFFVIGQAKFSGNHERPLTNGRGNAT